MFVVIYRWKLKEGMEAQFRENWHRVTEGIARKYGSLGSRLHRVDDGTWVAYAQWPTREARARAMREPPPDVQALYQMHEAIAERYNEMCMEVRDDLLRSEPAVVVPPAAAPARK